MRILQKINNLRGHYETIQPFMAGRNLKLKFVTERIKTNDNDFLDVFWKKQGSSKVVVLTHGLEGHAKQHYMLGMAQTFSELGYDILMWNLRGCGKELNRGLSLYHGGSIDDLHSVISYALEEPTYKEIALVGFSLGGNITLRYLGDKNYKISESISHAVAISTPCDLKASTLKLDGFSNRLYAKFFLDQMGKKLQGKRELLESVEKFYPEKIKTLKEFNQLVTADLHGFSSADDYYLKSSSKYVLKNIKVPSLIINALNDPFLEGECYPYKEVSKNKKLFLETPKYGGHVGFYNKRNNEFYSELRASEFIQKGSLFHSLC